MNVLDEDQIKAVEKMHNGCILVGGVGSGKTRTALAFYEKNYKDKVLYVITTAKKRNSKDWEEEAKLFDIREPIVDSWNNISKYIHKEHAFFIFDEQHATTYGKWGKSFITIAHHNIWITLSATPADTHMDLMCHFIANRYFRTVSEFKQKHVRYSHYVTAFPKIEGYYDEYILERLENQMYVNLRDKRKTKRHDELVLCDWNGKAYKAAWKDRWNPFEDKPIENVAELFQVIRRIVNTDPTRFKELGIIYLKHPKIIVFYNFDYELDMLKQWCLENDIYFREYNGHKHEDVPEGDAWIYLVQYFNCEAWNCTDTDTLVFFSQTYSYKCMEQAAGRIDRKNTPFIDLYYYKLFSHSPIDIAIKGCLEHKKNFNERRFYDQC